MFPKLRTFSLLLTILLCGFPVLGQQARQLIQDDETPRLALVIGNADYVSARKLTNPANDANDMAATLKGLGFDVIFGTNLSLKQMNDRVREFGDKLRVNGGVGLFYYAGHGIQVSGKNFLIPVEAEIPREDEIDFAALNLDLVLRKMGTAKNDLNIVILDACRNNPFAFSWSRGDSGDGLAQISAPTGTFIAYATSPDKTASDGTGRNGLYTSQLLKFIRQPNLKIEEAFKQVTIAVDRESSGKQVPWTSSSLRGEFYFSSSKSEAAVNTAPTNKSDSSILPDDKTTQEKEAWDLVKNSTDEQDFRMYLQEFPGGANAAKAAIKLEQIVWNAIRLTNDKSRIQAYLKEFPAGVNAPTARIKLRQIESRETAERAVDTASVTEKDIPVESKKTKTVETKPEKPKETATTKITKPKAKSTATSKNPARSNSIGMELVYIPAGSFMMGASERNLDESMRLARKDYADVEASWFDNEKPQRRVTFDDGFWMGKTEVTQAQWIAVMGENPSNFKGCDDCPVETVSWADAKAFIQKLNEKNDGFEYRLPSEAEWEYAARAGTTGLFSGPIDAMSWNSRTSEGKSHPVGTKQANAFGLFDMYGNVAEWCEDIYNQNYEGLPVDGSANADVGEKNLRVVRGGSWNNFPSLSRSTAREKYRVELRNIVIGFRVAARIK